MNAISQIHADRSAARGMVVHADLVQGSDEWLAARCGLLTASEMKLILTPTLKIASNDKERAHLFELMAQRINQYVEPRYIGDDMLRGQEDEVRARILYAEKIAPVTEVGFITNDKWGFTLGYSPDGLVGKKGAIEAKSRRQRFQAEMIADLLPEGEIFQEYCLQAQTGLLVADELEWIDHLSYCGGMPMTVVRVYPDAKVQDAILEASAAFEERLRGKLMKYRAALADKALRAFPTERVVEEEMFV